MKVRFSGHIPPEWSADQVYHAYNALDCAITLEVLGEIKPQLDEIDRPTYELTKSFQAVALEMMLRGVKVDLSRMREVRASLTETREDLLSFLQEMGEALGLPLRKPTKGYPTSHYINPNSPAQLLDLFYTRLGLPPIRVFDKAKGESRNSSAREALEKLYDRHFLPKPLVSTILAIRDAGKKIQYLQGVESDGRMRFSFNIAGTETGRWSSSKSVWGTGYNAQNIDPGSRIIFTADPGYKLCYLDLEQAESRLVGLLAPGKTYWDACHSGDLHTTTSRLVWPNLNWTGDGKADRKLADTIFYREYSYRDLGKRGGHGTNYYGKPLTMARHLHVQTKLIEDFQRAYFRAFPEIPEWHLEVKERLQLDRHLITPLGRRRWFHGRPEDDATLREAIAFVPQSAIADYLNTGLRNVWRRRLPIHLLLQVHDAIVFQYPEREEWVIPEVVKELSLSVEYRGKTLVIPSEPKVGWNWASASPTNPGGMVKWKGTGSDGRKRETLLDRVLR